MKILSLDLALTTGFAVGPAKGRPSSGRMQFAASTHEASFHKAMRWADIMIENNKPDVVVWEAPLATSFARGRTRVETTALLFGLPAIVGAIAHRHNVPTICKADARDVRLHFIGQNPKRVLAKRLTMHRCRKLGYEPIDDNEADAIALWHYTADHMKANTMVQRALSLGGHA
jgi:hypothetical protein